MNNYTTEINKEILSLKGPIAVFGAGGFIGANLLRRILTEREDCYGITQQGFVPWRLNEIPASKILSADIISESAVTKLFDHYPFQTVFCLAAYGAYSRQLETSRIYKTNLLGLINIIEAAKQRGCSSLVHAGSSSEYGLNCEGPLEKDTLLPNSHYSVSKVSAAYLLQYYSRHEHLPAINLRLYSAYGPWEEPDRLMPRIVEMGLEKKLPPFVDKNISRDFIYVDDVVDAIVLAATRGVSNAPGESINIASGRKTTIQEVADTAKEVFGVADAPVWQSMPNRRWDLQEWYGNPEKARTCLGWTAKTSLKEGLGKMRDWYKSRPSIPSTLLKLNESAPPRLSAIVACYKDAQAIPIMYDRLTKVFRELHVDYEIIFVNDASPDSTDEVLAKITENDNHVLAIEHSRNFGSQSAFLSGMQVSTGNACVLMDGDLQDPPEVIPSFFKKWCDGYEVVYGRRVQREATLFQNFFYRLFYRIFKKLSFVDVPLDAGDFSLIDRKVINEIVALPETDQFLRGLRAWVGFKQTGVDYVRPERMFGTTTNNLRKNFWWARKGIFSFSFVPLELFLYFGLGLTLISFVMLLGQIIVKLFVEPSTPHGITTIIVLILFFSGIQILAISILGEYLSKIFEETKRRPKFIRRALRHAGQRIADPKEMGDFLGSRKP